MTLIPTHPHHVAGGCRFRRGRPWVGEGLVRSAQHGPPAEGQGGERFSLKTFPSAIDGATRGQSANNVSDITAQQAADIYGKIASWKELGGTDAPITLYTRRKTAAPRRCWLGAALNKGSIVCSPPTW